MARDSDTDDSTDASDPDGRTPESAAEADPGVGDADGITPESGADGIDVGDDTKANPDVRADPDVDVDVDVGAMAITVAVPPALQWTDSRRGQEFRLTTLTIRMLPGGHLAVKAYGRPTAGGRGAYTSFRAPDTPAVTALVNAAATRAGELWSRHRGLA